MKKILSLLVLLNALSFAAQADDYDLLAEDRGDGKFTRVCGILHLYTPEEKAKTHKMGSVYLSAGRDGYLYLMQADQQFDASGYISGSTVCVEGTTVWWGGPAIDVTLFEVIKVNDKK